MQERYNLEDMLKEIQENEATDQQKETGKVSQNDIQKMLEEQLKSNGGA